MTVSNDMAATAARRVGTRVKDGKYTLDSVLGVGGMGCVYAARHRNGNQVAVKMLHPHFASVPEVRERFVREGYIANRIGHPGVVHIIDDDVNDDGTPFLVMELLSGHTLQHEWEEAARRRLSNARVGVVADRVLETMDAAHAAGVVHRDLKPDNVFILNDGTVKILDFGIARVADAARMTRTGQPIGTPQYMAPEQAGGVLDAIGPQTDLYSVGAMLFTLLSGEYVHGTVTQGRALVAAACNPARKLGTVLKGVDEALASVVDRALEFDPANRWSSAREMQAALRDAFGALEETMAGDAKAMLAELARHRK